jgi:hypothetical protein
MGFDVEEYLELTEHSPVQPALRTLPAHYRGQFQRRIRAPAYTGRYHRGVLLKRGFQTAL